MALNGLFCADVLRPLDLVPLTDFTYKYHPDNNISLNIVSEKPVSEATYVFMGTKPHSLTEAWKTVLKQEISVKILLLILLEKSIIIGDTYWKYY